MQGARGHLSQDLVALWVDEYGPALALMRRIFPAGLMRYLSVRKPTPVTPHLINPSQPLQVCYAQGFAQGYATTWFPCREKECRLRQAC